MLNIFITACIPTNTKSLLGSNRCVERLARILRNNEFVATKICIFTFIQHELSLLKRNCCQFNWILSLFFLFQSFLTDKFSNSFLIRYEIDFYLTVVECQRDKTLLSLRIFFFFILLNIYGIEINFIIVWIKKSVLLLMSTIVISYKIVRTFHN